MAISGEMPARPFTMSESCLRLSPSLAAASVTVSPKGSMQSCRTEDPGWGEFFIDMSSSPSVVVDEVDVSCVPALEAKDNAPIGGHSDRPAAGERSLERVQSETGQVLSSGSVATSRRARMRSTRAAAAVWDLRSHRAGVDPCAEGGLPVSLGRFTPPSGRCSAGRVGVWAIPNPARRSDRAVRPGGPGLPRRSLR